MRRQVRQDTPHATFAENGRYGVHIAVVGFPTMHEQRAPWSPGVAPKVQR